MDKLRDVLQRLIHEGADPNELQRKFDEAITDTLDWVLFGGGHWHRHMVCSKCGSGLAGVCADPGADVKLDDFDNPAYHKNQPGVRVIPYKEYQTRYSSLNLLELERRMRPEVFRAFVKHIGSIEGPQDVDVNELAEGHED